jgi:hypothetical protein
MAKKSGNDTVLIIGGIGLLYLLWQSSQGASAAQVAINTANLNAANTAANANVIGNAGVSIANDIGDMFG